MATPNNENLNLETKENVQNNVKFGPEKQKFYDLVLKDYKINPKTKENIKKILAKLSDDPDFFLFIDQNKKLADFIDKDTPIDNLEDFIENRFINTFISKLNGNELVTESNISEISREKEEISDIAITEEKKKEETATEKAQVATEKENEGLNQLKNLRTRYSELFKGDTEIENILEELKLNENDPSKVKEILQSLLANEKLASRFFNKIATSGDKTLYQDTITVFQNLGVSVPEKYIPIPILDPDLLISQFPDAKDGEITKRGDIVSFGDKTIDLRDKKAYISGENGYKLETSISLPDTLDLKAEYLAKKLEIKETINTDKKILELLGNKTKIKEKIDELERKKTGKLGEDTEINTLLTPLKEEIKRIDEKLKQAVPNYNEKQDDLLSSFLENSIKENEEKLNKLEEKYKKDLIELYDKSADKVKESDEKTRQTTLLLDSIGFTLIPQHITDDIIATINKNPEHYGFESRIDLKNGNFGGINNIATKERFIKKFNKMISGKEGEPITNEDINNILVKKIEKDKDSQEERNKELLAKFSTYNIMSDLGTWDREKLESNLTLKEKETTNKETK